MFAKQARIGHGKTRLAKGIGRVEAWRANRAMQARAFRLSQDARWRTLLAIAPDRSGPWPRQLRTMPQGKGDLGVRLVRALAPIHAPVAVIGVDCPEAEQRDIAQAFVSLRRARAAIGRTPDGGFWILALRRGGDAKQALLNVRWSSFETANDVVANLRGRLLTLPTRSDVDEAEDYWAWRRRESYWRMRA